MEAVLKGRAVPSWKTGTLSGRRERLVLEPRAGVTTPWRLHVRPGAGELLGWSLPDGGVSEIDAGMNSSGGPAWGREGRLYLPRLHGSSRNTPGSPRQEVCRLRCSLVIPVPSLVGSVPPDHVPSHGAPGTQTKE